MTAKAVDYVRRHHVGLLALMLVIAGGSAYAAGLAKNSVKSKQIKNGQVKSIDVADEGLSGADIGAGAVSAAELADGSVSGADLADGGIAGADVADGGLSGADVADGGLSGADLADGTVGETDLDSATVARVLSASGTFDDANFFNVIVADVAGLGQIEAKCDAPGTNLGVRYRNTTSANQQVLIGVRDPADADPGSAQFAQVAPAGIVVEAPNTFTGAIAEGDVWISGPAGTARVEVGLAHTGSDCRFWVQAVTDRN